MCSLWVQLYFLAWYDFELSGWCSACARIGCRGLRTLWIGDALAIRPTVQSVLLFVGVLSIASISTGMALAIACISSLLAMLVGFHVRRRLWRAGVSQTYLALDERMAWWRSFSIIGLTTVVRAAEAALPIMLIGALVWNRRGSIGWRHPPRSQRLWQRRSLR